MNFNKPFCRCICAGIVCVILVMAMIVLLYGASRCVGYKEAYYFIAGALTTMGLSIAAFLYANKQFDLHLKQQQNE